MRERELFRARFTLLLISIVFLSLGFAAACPAPITSSGTYTQTQNYVGAPNDARPVPSAHTCVNIAASNVVYDCNGYNISNNGTLVSYGIFVNSSYSNITIQNCPRIYYYYFDSDSAGIMLYRAQNISIRNVTLFRNSDGLNIYRGKNITIFYSFAINNSDNGFYAEATNLSNFNNNYAYNNTDYGFLIGGTGNTIRRAISHGNGGTGIRVGTSIGGTGDLYESSSYDNGGTGIEVNSGGVDGLNVYNNTAYNNSGYGFELAFGSYYNNVFNNTADNNSQAGFHIGVDSRANALYNNTASNNGGAGIHVMPSWSNSIYGNSVYGGAGDGIYIEGTSVWAASMPNNFTNNTVFDNSGYGFFLNMSNYSLIRSNNVHDNSQAGVYIYKGYYNTVNGTNASSNGNYGFRIHTSYGNTIDRSRASDSQYGFYIVSSEANNITNSNADWDTFGFYIASLSNSNRIYNCTSSSNDADGFHLFSGIGNSLERSMAYDNGYNGFYLNSGARRNNLISLQSYNNDASGFYLDASSNNTLANSTAHSNQYGIYLSSSSSNNLTNNTAYGNDNTGFYLSSSSYCNLLNNTAYNHSGSGFYLESSSLHNSLSRNTARNNAVGFFVYGSDYNTLSNNTAYTPAGSGLGTSYGFWIRQSSYNTLSDNFASNHSNLGVGSSGGDGFYFLQGSSNNALFRNTASGNKGTGFYFIDSPDNSMTDDSASSNSYYAVYINSSSGITISGIVISNQTYWIGPPGVYSLDIENLTTENGTSSVVFGDVSYSGSGLNSSNFIIGDGVIALDSSARPEFNTSARITMWTPSCSPSAVYVLDEFPTTRYDVIGRGRVCTECTIISCTGNTIVFDVPHWSGYAAGGETGLTITNDGPKYANDTITFTANYINTTDSSHLPGANCNLSLWNGSVYPMSEDVDHYELSLNVSEVGPHSYNVTCSKAGFTTLTAFDTFTIFFNGTLSGVDLYAANVTVGTTGRYSYNGSAGNITTEGGNVTNVSLYTNESTDRWAGFYGNVSGNIVLAKSSNTTYLYEWPWNPSLGGVVCASTGPTPLSSIMGATYADIDTAWGFLPTLTDSAANTFNNSNCSQKFGPATIANAYYADTGYSGGFITCAWKAVAAPSKAEMLFCTNITQNGPLAVGGTGDFEMMVPTAYGTSAYETYYFYVNLG